MDVQQLAVKKCTHCGKDFRTDNLRLRLCSDDCRRSANLACTRRWNKNPRVKKRRAQYSALWGRENKERVACNHYKSRYGISLERVRELIEMQGFQCAVCSKTITLDGAKGRDKAAVDHCHDSGVVRGLLCANCNLMLGYSGDKADTLRSAASYLEEIRH